VYTFVYNVTTDDQLSQKKGLRMQHDSQDIQNDHGEPNLEALGDILPRLLAIYGMDHEVADAEMENGVEAERGPLVGVPV